MSFQLDSIAIGNRSKRNNLHPHFVQHNEIQVIVFEKKARAIRLPKLEALISEYNRFLIFLGDIQTEYTENVDVDHLKANNQFFVSFVLIS